MVIREEAEYELARTSVLSPLELKTMTFSRLMNSSMTATIWDAADRYEWQCTTKHRLYS